MNGIPMDSPYQGLSNGVLNVAARGHQEERGPQNQNWASPRPNFFTSDARENVKKTLRVREHATWPDGGPRPRETAGLLGSVDINEYAKERLGIASGR